VARNDKKRLMPTRTTIRAHWAPRWKEFPNWKIDSQEEFLEFLNGCFACGWDHNNKVERAHITAKTEGGSDQPENLHLLCRACHDSSEFLKGEAYWEWIRKRTAWCGLVGMAKLSPVFDEVMEKFMRGMGKAKRRFERTPFRLKERKPPAISELATVDLASKPDQTGYARHGNGKVEVLKPPQRPNEQG